MGNRYYILERDHLTYFGTEVSYSRNEAQYQLDRLTPEEMEHLVILYGAEVSPRKVQVNLPPEGELE